jgi:hypothetical protein
MSVFFLWIWIGGACALEDKKIGFFNRIIWPIILGEALFSWAMEYLEERKND